MVGRARSDPASASASLRLGYDSLPEQLLGSAEWFLSAGDVLAGVAGLSSPRPATVALLASGDAAFATSACAVLAARDSPLPVVAIEGSALPAWVGPSTLVLAVASGDDDPGGSETAGAIATALRRRAPVVVVAGHGSSLARTVPVGASLVELPAPVSRARACLGTLLAPLLLLLERAGAMSGVPAAITGAGAQARSRRDSLACGDRGTGPAGLLARRLARTVPIIYGDAPIGSLAAQRFKAAINQNAKSPAFAASASSFAYEGLCGFGQNGDVTRQLVSFVVLRSDYDESLTDERLERLEAALDEVVVEILVERAEGTQPLAQLLDLVQMGDATSLEMAGLEGIDPAPVPASERLLGDQNQ